VVVDAMAEIGIDLSRHRSSTRRSSPTRRRRSVRRGDHHGLR
jgi:hypothetical protein